MLLLISTVNIISCAAVTVRMKTKSNSLPVYLLNFGNLKSIVTSTCAWEFPGVLNGFYIFRSTCKLIIIILNQKYNLSDAKLSDKLIKILFFTLAHGFSLSLKCVYYYHEELKIHISFVTLKEILSVEPCVTSSFNLHKYYLCLLLWNVYLCS